MTKKRKQKIVFRKKMRKKRMKSTECIITMNSVAIERQCRKYHVTMSVWIRMGTALQIIVRNVRTGLQLKRFPASMSWKS